GCLPDSLVPCERGHVTGKYPPCTGQTKTPTCSQKCSQSYPTSYLEDKHKAAEWYTLMGNKSIMWELFNHGPVTANLMVYSDFLSYKSGIYHHVTGEFVGHHSVKILGWGVESGVQYWTVANSWTKDWGDHGFVKIRKGCCMIEGYVATGLPAT
ncbi:hypothetical protein RRG08_045669, partial [Elysia crispata]